MTGSKKKAARRRLLLLEPAKTPDHVSEPPRAPERLPKPALRAGGGLGGGLRPMATPSHGASQPEEKTH